MLGVISLGILALTLNWFDVATAFPLIGAQFKVGLGPLSYLISLYIVQQRSMGLRCRDLQRIRRLLHHHQLFIREGAGRCQAGF
jgi:hypothetical protein